MRRRERGGEIEFKISRKAKVGSTWYEVPVVVSLHLVVKHLALWVRVRVRVRIRVRIRVRVRVRVRVRNRVRIMGRLINLF